jgi:hemerythrin-like domain-containing protein
MHGDPNMADTETSFAIDPELLSDPLAFMEADHARISTFCDRLQALLRNLRQDGSDVEAATLLHILKRDLADHVSDEEDLFRLLEDGGKVDDGLREIIRVLRNEHAADHEAKQAISAELQRFIAGEDMRAPARFFVVAGSYSENQRRHLTWENCTVIPAARRLLAAEDMAWLSTRMRERRTGQTN